MSAAQADSSSAVVGRQVKILRRLSVSDTPVTLSGPLTVKSRKCVNAVVPNTSPMLVSARVCSIGMIRSSAGPSNRCTNTADTRCWPALMLTLGVCIVRPFGSCSFMRGLMSINATRSPSIETSICSPRYGPPNKSPVGPMCNMILKWYSPSAGNTCSTDSPPRVPSGAPSTWRICDAVRGTFQVVEVGEALRSPTASRLI